jgi:N-methylhydantoinase A
MTLDADAATRAVQLMADSIGLPLIETAEGITTLLNANMANAVRARTVQKGIDPRDYTLVASGGAGPLHGAEVARMLEIPEVIVPPYPGINSAIGLLTTDLKYDVIQTSFLLSSDMDYKRMNTQFTEMESQLRSQFEIDGVNEKDTRFNRYADVHYIGQGYELRVSMPTGEINESNISESLDEFHQLHHDEYGHSFPGQAVEFVNIRLVGIGPVPKIDRPPAPLNGSLESAVVKIDTTAFRIDDEILQLDTTFYRRDALPLDELINGPAIILQTDSTTVVPPDCSLRADPVGTLTIHIGKS